MVVKLGLGARRQVWCLKYFPIGVTVVITNLLQDSSRLLSSALSGRCTVFLRLLDQTTQLAVSFRAIHVLIWALVEVFGDVEKLADQAIMVISWWAGKWEY